MQQFNIDISAPRGPLVLYASQGDSLSRFFEVTVTNNGAAYEPPAGAIYTVRFGAPGMPAGWYDTITEVGGGTHPAVVVSGSTITVELAEQAVSVPGTNAVVLIVSDATGYTLASWAFELQVAAVPGYDAPEATVYYNALSEQVAQTLTNAQAAAASASAAAASATQAAESAASIDPSTLVKEVNGETPVSGAVSVTTQNLEYQVGDTITTSNASFDPNTAVGGTWEKVTSGVGFTAATKLQLDPSATSPNGQNCTFSVSNGVCTVTLDTITTPGGSITTIADNLPPPANRIFYSASNGAAAVINPGSSAMQSILPTGFSAEIFTLSYAIANASAGYGKTVYVWTKTA